MRPDGIEGLRAIQAAINEFLLPEVKTPFGQEAAQAATMMAESLAGEWDTAVADLVRDNGRLREVLGEARSAIDGVAAGNESAGETVKKIDEALSSEPETNLAVSALATENGVLMAALESAVEVLEDLHDQDENVRRARAEAYRFLREVAVRGWSFFDVSSFRERMLKARAEPGS